MFVQIHADLQSNCYFFIMSEEEINCSGCNRAIPTIARYCCNPMQPYCGDCYSFACNVCLKKRTSEKLKEQNYKNRILCIDCNKPEVKEKQEYFFESKCREYYCHQCLMVFYRKYCEILRKYQKQHGITLQMQVELKCGCELERKVIVDFLRKYCELCGDKNEGQRCIELANQCKIMLFCYTELSLEIQNQAYPKVKRKELTQLHLQIIKEIVKCGDCKSIIDEYNIGKKVNGIFKCIDCLENAKETQIRYFEEQDKREVRKDWHNIFCKQCNNQVPFAICDFFAALCKECKLKQIEKNHEVSSKEEDLIRRNCEKCNKFYFIKSKQLKQTKYCVVCEPIIADKLRYLNTNYKNSDCGILAWSSSNQKDKRFNSNIDSRPDYFRNYKPFKMIKQKQTLFKVEEKRQEKKEDNKASNSDFNALECKICFNAESTMMNKACRHLMMCDQCFKVYSRKHEGAKRLACPLCSTLGQYFFYIAPIYS